jgi:hypothetical protein
VPRGIHSGTHQATEVWGWQAPYQTNAAFHHFSGYPLRWLNHTAWHKQNCHQVSSAQCNMLHVTVYVTELLQSAWLPLLCLLASMCLPWV